MSDIVIREEAIADFKAIKEINNFAFNQIQEGEEGSLCFDGGMIKYPDEYYAAM